MRTSFMNNLVQIEHKLSNVLLFPSGITIFRVSFCLQKFPLPFVAHDRAHQFSCLISQDFTSSSYLMRFIGRFPIDYLIMCSNHNRVLDVSRNYLSSVHLSPPNLIVFSLFPALSLFIINYPHLILSTLI